MRKVILNLAVSLDGYIEGPEGEYDWCFTDQDYGMSDFFSTVDTIFIGRKSYEMIAGLEEQTFPGIKIYVFSDTLTTTLDNPNVALIPRANFLESVKEITAQEGGNIWLFGGSGLVTDFITHKLITDYWLSVHPVVLGGGKPLFPQLPNRLNLALMHTQAYATGLVQLRYAPQPEFDFNLLNDSYIRSNAYPNMN